MTRLLWAALGGFAIGCVPSYGRARVLRRRLAEARRDPVTGLATREVAERTLEALTRDRVQATIALADVDGLRTVNNRLGHAAGDAYLAAVASRLRGAVPNGLAARLGGDEFVLISTTHEPHDLAHAVGTALCGTSFVAGLEMTLRASVGLAATHGGDAHLALALADAAMYAAKANSSSPTVHEYQVHTTVNSRL